MRVGVLFAVGLILVGCATVSPVADEDRLLPLGCDDIVLIGRLKNGDYNPINDEADIIGHGWISATLQVRRVVGGAKVPSVVPVRYLAHTYLRDDREFMFVAARATGGVYVIKTVQLTSVHPKLASNCK